LPDPRPEKLPHAVRHAGQQRDCPGGCGRYAAAKLDRVFQRGWLVRVAPKPAIKKAGIAVILEDMLALHSIDEGAVK